MEKELDTRSKTTSASKSILNNPDIQIVKFKNLTLVNKEATSSELKELVYKIRYESYIPDNHIDARKDQKLSDIYDGMKNCHSYIIYQNDEPVGTIRSCVYSSKYNWVKIPVLDIFAEEISSNIEKNKTLIEINKLTILPKFQKKFLLYSMGLFRNILINTYQYHADYLLAAVRTNHIRFYKNIFLLPISKEKVYPGVKFKTVLLAGDVNKYRNIFLKNIENSPFASINI